MTRAIRMMTVWVRVLFLFFFFTFFVEGGLSYRCYVIDLSGSMGRWRSVRITK